MWESFNKLLDKWAWERPEKPAVVQSARRISYRVLRERACALAQSWAERGIAPGDRIVSYCGNTLEAVISLAACWRSGAVFVPLNPSIKPSKLGRILDELEPAVIVAPRGKLPDLRRIAASAAHMPTLCATDTETTRELHEFAFGTGGTSEGDFDLQAFWRLAAKPSSEDIHGLQAIPGNPAAILYTADGVGGTRGVVLSRENLAFASEAADRYLRNTSEDILVSALPVSLGYGLQQAVGILRAGGTLVLEPSFAYPTAVLQTIERTRATGFPIVPSMAGILLCVDVERFDLSSLRYIVNFGGPLATEHVARLAEAFPGAGLWSSYGRTECLHTAFAPLDATGAGSGRVGKAFTEIDARVVDEKGETTAPEVAGTLAVCGPNVMLGYWRRPQATESVLRGNSRTGGREFACADRFRTDLDGNLYFVGRGDDTLEIGGETAAPREIEAVLRTHPGVVDAMVYEDRDELTLDGRICAVVRLRRKEQVSHRELQMFCAEHLEDFMIPAVIRVRHQAIPAARFHERARTPRTSSTPGRTDR